MTRMATEKQLEWIRAMMGFKIFTSEKEVLMRHEIMVWLKGDDIPMSQASAYIAACKDLPDRKYTPKGKRPKSSRVFKARKILRGRMSLGQMGGGAESR